MHRKSIRAPAHFPGKHKRLAPVGAGRLSLSKSLFDKLSNANREGWVSV